MIRVGSLVISRRISTGKGSNDELGIGKVAQISNQVAVVQYFCSVGQRIEKTIALSSLYRVELQYQTRCYIKLENQDKWIIGRIFAWDEDNNKYQVDLPDKKTLLATEQEVYVRCNIPIEDPIDILAMKGQETPYFHDRRFAVYKCLVSQRAVSRGMTGLISSNIELLPHQVEVVRRVLEDPIQRYLLADEVGLGKTIEAGAILRQYLLDEPQGQALVVVPQYLVAQWHQELENKFYISHFPDRVKVVALEDVHKVNRNANIGFLILDEAHHIAAMANSSQALQIKNFDICKHLAHKSKALLLLSATPVLNHEQDFLAMLHLLDPITYRLDDLSGFRTKLQKRAEIGRVLLSFNEGANPLVLKKNLSKLGELFPEDKYLLSLLDELQNSLQTNSPDSSKIVRVIRTHISDTYRLHRRMLRNGRGSVEDVIFDREITAKVEYDLDERSTDIHELIEEWRTVAPNEKQYHRIFLLLFRASGTWLGILEQVIVARLNGISPTKLIPEFGDAEVRSLIETPKFSGEEGILQSLLKIIQQPSEDGDRIELLKTVLLYHFCEPLKLQSFRGNPQKLLEQVQMRVKRPIPGDKWPKIIVFTSFIQSGTEIFKCLTSIFGEVAVVSHRFGQSPSQVEENIHKFKIDPNCFILVCDPSGEEGRNLQFADWMIHFDLPWSANRLEQRIGRIDRIGRSLQVEFTVFAGADLTDSLHDTWYQLLRQGFKIFQESIASLQFYVDEKLIELEATMFESGAKGLLEAIGQIENEIDVEKVKIREQNALDEIDALDEGATQYFQALDDYDAQHKEIQNAIEGWMNNALDFKKSVHTDLSEVQRYKHNRYTLVPADDIKNHFLGCLEEFGTYNRRVANKNNGVNLYRIGEKLFEALASYTRWDDRGQAFAMWRFDESWDTEKGSEWFGFRFNFVIDTNLIEYQEEVQNSKTLNRLADGLFPPFIETIFLDARSEPMHIVEDAALLDILQRPYLAKKKRSNSKYYDYNLAKSKLPILDNFVEASEWQNFCSQARETALELLCQRPDFVKLCEKYAQVAEQKLGRRIEQLRLRLNKLAQNTLEQEISRENNKMQAIVEGIRHPYIRLDSVGFIIVSGRPLVEPQEEGDDL
jgi:ATP-dependent helicase HepA